MKKLILCSLITISVAFSVDCNAITERYNSESSMLIESCIYNNNADVCFCSSSVVMHLSEKSRKSGNYNKANKYEELAILLAKRACRLGNRETCAILDEAGIRR